MSKQINDNEWEDIVRGVNDPPEVPRQKMWQAIDAARQERRQVVTAPEFQRSRTSRWWRVAAAMAAVLVLGVAVGRMTVTPNGPVTVKESAPPVAVARTTVNSATAQEVDRLAAADLFGRADFLLTGFKVRTCTQQELGATPGWASGLLLQTRLLLDTPFAKDPEMQQLLEELELVLAQIVGLSRDNCARDMAWIKQGLQERSTLDRLRMVSDSRNQGAL